MTTAPAQRVTLAQLRRMPAAVDVTTAALALGVSRSAAYEAIRAGTFPGRTITVGRRIKVVTASLIDLLDTRAAGRPA